jgi:hypothetical protein
VGPEEFPVPLTQLPPARTILLDPRQLAADADELGPVGVAALVEPVGVNEARTVLLRVVQDGPQEGSFGHIGAIVPPDGGLAEPSPVFRPGPARGGMGS